MMQHSSRRAAHRRRQLIQVALVIGVVAGFCLRVVIVRAYDIRLNEALAALQKAAALVEASSAGVVSPRTQHRFDNERDKALASIQDAMEHVAAAGLAADSDGGSQ